jgi:hypothetical protein
VLYIIYNIEHRFDWEYLTTSTNLSRCCPYIKVIVLYIGPLIKKVAIQNKDIQKNTPKKSSSFFHPYPTKWGRYNGRKKIRQLFLRPAACLTSTVLELEWVLTTKNAAGTNSLTCLPNHGGARDNKFWSPIRRLIYTNVA